MKEEKIHYLQCFLNHSDLIGELLFESFAGERENGVRRANDGYKCRSLLPVLNLLLGKNVRRRKNSEGWGRKSSGKEGECE